MMEFELESHKNLHSWREYLIEMSLDAVVGISIDSLIVDWNPQAENIFGWKREEVIGKDVAQLIIPPEFREDHYNGIRRFKKFRKGKILNRRIELPALHKNGHKFTIELTVSDLTIDEGTLFYAFVRDVTERRRMEEALKDAIREKDEFISICSHELKTPITAMKLQFQIAKKMADANNPKVYSTEEVHKRIKTTLSQLGRMSSLIENMLDVTRLPKGQLKYAMEPVELNLLLKDVHEQLKDQLEENGINFELILPDEKILVKGDQYRLEQVFLNLINNAIKYGEKSPIRVCLETCEKSICIKFRDSGPGIAEGDRQKIFNRFTRLATKTNTSGLGLGLYISFNIVKAHGGTIELESKLGEGTTFTVRLPRHYVQ